MLARLEHCVMKATIEGPVEVQLLLGQLGETPSVKPSYEEFEIGDMPIK
jgi:hypothetical protein